MRLFIEDDSPLARLLPTLGELRDTCGISSIETSVARTSTWYAVELERLPVAIGTPDRPATGSLDSRFGPPLRYAFFDPVEGVVRSWETNSWWFVGSPYEWSTFLTNSFQHTVNVALAEGMDPLSEEGVGRLRSVYETSKLGTFFSFEELLSGVRPELLKIFERVPLVSLKGPGGPEWVSKYLTGS